MNHSSNTIRAVLKKDDGMSDSTTSDQISLFGDAIVVPKKPARKASKKAAAKKPEPKPVKSAQENVPKTNVPKANVLIVPQREEPFSVGELTQRIKGTLKDDPTLGQTLTVEGELSNFNPSSRGHVYFMLKDENAAIKGVMWASIAQKLKFDLEDGMAVTVTGTLDVYAPNGTYSLVAKRIEPIGIGPLQLAFMQLKDKLADEGLFDAEYKQDIPEFPRRIGIVTAKTGAVIHDMLRVLHRKNPLLNVILAPVTVQGDGAALSIAQAIEQLNDPRLELDTLIVGRGGGSFEDLFCFSEEPVVRAIFNSRLPIIAGVGHEPDFSLADAVADRTCSTPTAAAEAVTIDLHDLKLTLESYQDELVDHLQGQLQEAEQRFDYAATGFTQGLQHAIERAEQKTSHLSQQFSQWGSQLLDRHDAQLSKLAGELQAYSPLKTLSRGYSMATNPITEAIVTSITQIKAGQPLAIDVSDGTINTVVVSNNPTTIKAEPENSEQLDPKENQTDA